MRTALLAAVVASLPIPAAYPGIVLDMNAIAPREDADPASDPAVQQVRRTLRSLKANEQLLRARLEQRPDDVRALHDLGTVLSHQGRITEARQFWDQAADNDPNFPSAALLERVQQVFALLDSDQPLTAQKELKALEAKHGDDPHFQVLRGHQAFSGGNLPQAEAAYLKAVELAPGLSVAQLALGRFYESQARHAEARACYEAATRCTSPLVDCWIALGAHQFKQGKLGDALESLRSAEEADAGGASAEERMAVLHEQIGDRLGVRRWYSAALERRPERGEVIRRRLVQVNLDLGLREEARRHLDALLARHRSPELLTVLGTIEQLEGNAAAAETLYREVLEQNPLAHIARNNLAMLLIEQGRSGEESLRLIQLSCDAAPQDGNLWSTRACALFAAQRTDEARKALADAVRVSPNDPWVRFCLGQLLLQDGDREAARVHLEGCVILRPDFSRRRDIQELLEAL